MVTSIDTLFIEQFEREVHHEFQRMGSALRNTVRTKNNVRGSTARFNIAGTGVAGSKDRHGIVPIMNADRSKVTATLADRYAGEYIDKLDELKIEHDERQVAAQTVAAALGRDVDQILTTAMAATTNSANETSADTWSDATEPLSYMAAFGNNDVPFDGQLYFAVCWEAWADLIDINEFANQDYVPGDQLWFAGITAKRWLGFQYFPFSGLQVDGTGDKIQLAWHRSAIGHAIGQDFMLDVTWQGKEQAHLAVGSMSHGAIIIEDEGVLKDVYDITP